MSFSSASTLFAHYRKLLVVCFVSKVLVGIWRGLQGNCPVGEGPIFPPSKEASGAD